MDVIVVMNAASRPVPLWKGKSEELEIQAMRPTIFGSGTGMVNITLPLSRATMVFLRQWEEFDLFVWVGSLQSEPAVFTRCFPEGPKVTDDREESPTTVTCHLDDVNNASFDHLARLMQQVLALYVDGRFWQYVHPADFKEDGHELTVRADLTAVPTPLLVTERLVTISVYQQHRFLARYLGCRLDVVTSRDFDQVRRDVVAWRGTIDVARYDVAHVARWLSPPPSSYVTPVEMVFMQKVDPSFAQLFDKDSVVML